jgi:hypothetical protein
VAASKLAVVCCHVVLTSICMPNCFITLARFVSQVSDFVGFMHYSQNRMRDVCFDIVTSLIDQGSIGHTYLDDQD